MSASRTTSKPWSTDRQAFGKLDVAVNNAGFTGSPGQLATQTLEACDAVFGANARGLFLSQA
jgi:NAD(P)-dependent dehydrogenase (short-subunit alcohol dehydrogenase family)